MAINPETTDTVAITQLDPLVLALESFLVGANADGKMGNFTAQQLAELIAPYVSAIGSSPFVANTGSPLPNPIAKPTAITFVGSGTFTQTTGSSVVTTQPLNVLFWSSNGITGTWTLGVAIPIVLTDYVNKTLDIQIDNGTQLFNKNSYRVDTVLGTGGQLVTGISGAGTTNDIPILSGQTHISWSGIESVAVSKLINFYNSSGTFISPSVTVTTLSGTAPIPAGATMFRFYFMRTFTQSALDSFMVNFGNNNILPVQDFSGPQVSNIINKTIVATRVQDMGIINVVGTSNKSVINRKFYDENIPISLSTAILEEDLDYKILSKNLLDPLTIINGVEYNAVSHTVLPAPSGNDSVVWLRVEEGVTYFVSGLPSGATSNRNYGFFKEDQTTFISQSFISASVQKSSITAPSDPDVKWLVLTIRGRSTNTNFSALMFNVGGELPYDTFVKGVQKILTHPIVAEDVESPVLGNTEGKKFLLFGDSITETLAANGTPLTNWPTYAGDYLKWASFSNYARSGASYTDKVSHTEPRQDMHIQIDDAIAASETPDIIVIAAGINDGSVTGDYTIAMAKTTLVSLDRTLLFEALRWVFWTMRITWPTAQCYCSIPLQVASVETANLQTLYDAITKMAKRYGIRVMDSTYESGIIRDREFVGSPGYYMVDGLHLNTLGKQVYARYISGQILSTYMG